MPYYCTVPRCTSMAGKAKNVSFHQFPRDEELAKLWNRILKRGKPYTKYSKVCSLHFKPEDYTITSVGKNKGQWRTLRKDAIPSQNLPSESPVPYTRRPSGCWVPSQPNVTDPLVQQQVAQAIYMQTMLAMQTAGASDPLASGEPQTSESSKPSPSSSSLSEIELLLRRDTDRPKDVTYKCHECSKCFKDPDVFLLHKRTHKNDTTLNIEKENYSANIQDSEETLRANPILANLLKTSMRLEPESNMANILTVENQIMAALASNMEAYIRTLSSMLASQTNEMETENNDRGSDYDETKDDGEEKDVKVKCEDNEFSEDECVDTKEYDTPMDQETDNAHRNITADEEIQNEYKDDILNHFSDQTAGENRVETPIDENRSSETECIDDNYTKKDEISNDLTDTMDEDRGVASDDKNMNNGNIIDDKYTTKEISNDHDTKIDEDRSSASNDISINDDNIRKENHEASNDIHNKSTNYTKTDSPADYEAQIDAIDNDEYANDNKIPNTTENKSTTNENDIYTAEHKLADDTSSNECEANDALVDVNKYSSDANDVIDEMVNGKDGELVQGDFACDSPVVTVENVIEIDIEFET